MHLALHVIKNSACSRKGNRSESPRPVRRLWQMFRKEILRSGLGRGEGEGEGIESC
jgi:hypothetical protein